MMKLPQKTNTRTYDSHIHENMLTLDHLSVYAYSSSLKPNVWGSKDRSKELQNVWKEYVRTISDNLPKVKDRKGQVFRDFLYGRAKIGQKPISIFYGDYCEAISVESIIYKPEKMHSIWFTLNVHKNIRRLCEGTCNIDKEFDAKIKINNDNYTIPEVVNQQVVRENLFNLGYIKDQAQAIYQLFYDEKRDMPIIDEVKMSQVEITRDYTVPYYGAQQCMRDFVTFLMSPTGVEWRNRHDFSIMSSFRNDDRGDSSVKLSRISPALVFKVYAKNMATVRTELRIETPKTLDFFNVSRNLEDIREVYTQGGKILKSFGFKKILMNNFKHRKDMNYAKIDKFFYGLPDLCTGSMYSYLYGKFGGEGLVPAAKVKKYMTPELRAQLEPVKHGNKCFWRLPCDRPLRKRCVMCNTYTVISSIKCPKCGSLELIPTNTNVGRIGVLRRK